MKHRFLFFFSLTLVSIFLACDSPSFDSINSGTGVPIGKPLDLISPLGLPPIPVPADNPATLETIELGRRLYYDTSLSVDGTLSCASCHNPKFGFSDGNSFSEGVNGQKGGRNAPTIFNAAYYNSQFWDGRSPSLEDQAEGPVQNPIEMAHTLEAVEKTLSADLSYQDLFKKAFGPRPIRYEMVGKAIAAFERTVVSGNSPFDRYFYRGEQVALNDTAKRGLEIFRNPQKGNCTACHVLGLFTDNLFHNIGVGVDENGELTDLGRFEVTGKDSDRGAFKTPSLRNIALTAPYMHDGSLKTLGEVIDFYVGGGNSNENLDPQMKILTPLTETGEENWSRADLEAFLESLTGEIPQNIGPPEEK